MSAHTDTLRLLEILLNAKHYPEQDTVESKIIIELSKKLGITNPPQRSVDIYNYNFQTGVTELNDIESILQYHTQAQLEIERDRTEQEIRVLERKLEDQKKYFADLKSVCNEASDVYGMYKHVKENHEHIVFDYEMRKGNE